MRSRCLRAVFLLASVFYLLSSSVQGADHTGKDNSLRDTTTGDTAKLKLHDNGDGTFSVVVQAAGVTFNGTLDPTNLALSANQVAIQAAPGANPSPSPGKAVAIQGIDGGKAVPVSVSETQLTIVISNVTTTGSVAAGKRHIEFILSSDFAGTIGGVTIPATLGIYSPGDAPAGKTFAALAYTITAGNAILTTW